MGKFIRSLFIFSFLPLILLIGGIGAIFHVSNKIEYALNDNIKEIYIGDSHIQCAINDSLLPHGKNVSASSESFYFSYFKLKKILEENPHIERVYLGASYHNLSGYYDDFISGDYSPFVSPKYFYVLPLKEKLKLVYWNIEHLPAFLKNISSISYGYLCENPNFDFGGYSNNFHATMAIRKSMEKRLRLQYYKDEELIAHSEINLSSLKNIIALCKSHNVDLWILNTPLHWYFKSKIPEIHINKFNATVNTYQLKSIDFDHMHFTDSSFIPDGDHLSAKGADAFTKKILRCNVQD